MENYDLKALKVVVFKTEAHVFMRTARGQVKTHTHATALSVRIYAAIFKQHSNIFQKKKIPISWNAEAVLMSGGGLIIHLVLMLAFNF